MKCSRSAPRRWRTSCAAFQPIACTRTSPPSGELRQGITSEPFWIVSLSIAGEHENDFRELAIVRIDANTGKVDSVRIQR